MSKQVKQKLSLSPIPLTEEWLLKLGGVWLVQEPNRYNFYNNVFVTVIEDSFLYWITEFETCVEVKYVHQLQNLYFALTDEERITTE